MSHDAQHGHGTENKAIISFGNSFWLVIILVGLFIASVNFVQIESSGTGHEGGHGDATHETHHGSHGAAGGHEATHEGTTPHAADAAAPATIADDTKEGTENTTEEPAHTQGH